MWLQMLHLLHTMTYEKECYKQFLSGMIFENLKYYFMRKVEGFSVKSKLRDALIQSLKAQHHRFGTISE